MNRSSEHNRNVPFNVIFNAMFGEPITWILFGVGTILMWLILPNVDVLELLDFRGNLETREGKVVDISRPNSNVFDGMATKYNYQFEFDGKQYNGVSYSRDELRQNNTVSIEFPPGRPERSRISNMRCGILSPLWLIAMILPIGTFLILAKQMVRGIRKIMLLASGEHTLGILVEKEILPSSNSNNNRYRLTFEFIARDGRRYRTAESVGNVKPLSGEEMSLANSKLMEQLAGNGMTLKYVRFKGRLFRQVEDGSSAAGNGQSPGQQIDNPTPCSLQLNFSDRIADGEEHATPVFEHLVYHPSRPTRAAMLDTMPGSPRILGDGTIVFHGSSLRWMSILAPMAVAAINAAWYAIFR